MGSQFSGIDGVIQAHHQLISPGRVRFHHMGRGGIDDGAFLVEEDDPVQTVRVAGTVDLFDALALLLGGLGQMLHQGGFAASRPAFDEKHLHPGLPAQRLKITLEARRCGGPQKEIGGTALDRFHIRTPHFCFRVCKNEGR